MLKVSVGPDQPATIGTYQIDNGRIVFTPMFPLDPRAPVSRHVHPPGAAPLTSIVSLPARDTTPTTMVAEVYPTAEVVPENQLRLYIHFSAPMGSKGGLSYMHLFADDGAEVADPFLPLDAEFFNDDRTRYTVFFDPGRQKRGIAPIADMGRSLTEGKSYTLVVDAEWRDGNGLPLTQQFKRTFKVGPPDEKPLDPKTWTDRAARRRHARAVDGRVPRAARSRTAAARAWCACRLTASRCPVTVAVGTHELTWPFTPQNWSRRTTTSSRLRCWKILRAIESAARLKSISSIARTRAASPRRR